MEKVLEGPKVHFNAGEGCQVNWSTVDCLQVLEKCCVANFLNANRRFSCLFHQRKRSLFLSVACPSFSTMYLSSVALPLLLPEKS